MVHIRVEKEEVVAEVGPSCSVREWTQSGEQLAVVVGRQLQAVPLFVAVPAVQAQPRLACGAADQSQLHR